MKTGKQDGKSEPAAKAKGLRPRHSAVQHERLGLRKAAEGHGLEVRNVVVEQDQMRVRVALQTYFEL